ncbi:endonuclease/exonuclease/phosphatase family protein [Roseibium sp. MMSF_3544]|uniref:endonuclease/exonuclease/phosphatase family protein n=1 Tax=unclassified Roseibium TaxID=2629323 RepID=UPI00273E27BE|nr:endonuclease/exonuclease/phosphatase family protein [Roseibium sp. MMSF_3544]
MAFYHWLNRYKDREKNPEKAKWIAEHLLKLRADLAESKLGDREPNSLVIGSWNIRAFDDGKPRRDESFHYIAEIIGHFDVCAIQEVKEDLEPLNKLKTLLGPNWSYIVTDVTEGSKGNTERQAFFFNTNKVFFRNLVGEVVLPPEALLEHGQIARTPFFASFQAGWFKFTLMSVHIIFGGSTKKKKKMRAAEVEILAKLAAKRAKKEGQVYVLIGDMNIESRDDEIMAGLKKHGLFAPLFGATNLKGTKHYDQIAFTGEKSRTRCLQSGSVDWRTAVYRPDEKDHYEPIALEARGGEPYKNWDKDYEKFFASFEMSDHLPIWVEMEIDYSNEYLKRFI